MHEEVSSGQLLKKLEIAANQVAVGARYMHYKQLNYKVVAIALREEDAEPCVIYEAEYTPGVTWIRPVASWIEEVDVDGVKTPRFTRIKASS